MPNVNIHRRQAIYNERLAMATARSGYRDWAVTMCFYSALHHTEAYAVFHGDDIRDFSGNSLHRKRINYIDDIEYRRNFDGLVIAYQMLFYASMEARYLETLSCIAKEHFPEDLKDFFEALTTVKRLLETP
jgi:hypothetical protein